MIFGSKLWLNRPMLKSSKTATYPIKFKDIKGKYRIFHFNPHNYPKINTEINNNLILFFIIAFPS